MNALRGSPPLDSSDWDSVAEFFQRSWFSRLWVVQELAMAVEPIIIVGEYLMDWPTIPPAPDGFAPLIGLLVSCGTWGVTNERDRLYSFFGLAEETEYLKKCPKLAPDYSKSVRMVYQDLAKHLLLNPHNTTSNRLLCLSAVQHRPGKTPMDTHPGYHGGTSLGPWCWRDR